MPNLGPPELIIILVITMIVFGVGRLPEVGRSLGQGIREFRNNAKAMDPDDHEVIVQQNNTEHES